MKLSVAVNHHPTLLQLKKTAEMRVFAWREREGEKERDLWVNLILLLKYAKKV